MQCVQKNVISRYIQYRNITNENSFGNQLQTMFAASESPDIITPAELDDYLAKGWFRMNQTIFTTHFLQFNNQFYAAVWLRVALHDYEPDNKHKALLERNKKFRTEIKKAEITLQHEDLYDKYKKAVSFEAYASLNQLLLNGYTENIYDSWQVNVYDNDTLIAAGFFDVGNTSAEGIVCIYHPDYKKYSLGKYLIYTKLDYCRQHQLTYFYPGYVVPGYKAFDYKQDLGRSAMHYYNIATNQWVKYSTLADMYNPLTDMREKLETLQTRLEGKYVKSKLLYYRFFDGVLNIRFWADLLDYPVFLLPGIIKKDHTAIPIIVYNILNGRYLLLECTPIYKTDVGNINSNVFSSDILSIDRCTYDTPDVDKMAAVLTWNDSL